MEGSKRPEKCLERLNTFLQLLKKLKHHEIIILSDSNLNTRPTHSDFQDSSSLKSIWIDFMTEHNFGVYNDQLTFFKPNVEPSTIDHIWGNCVKRISNIITTPHHLSPDH